MKYKLGTNKRISFKFDVSSHGNRGIGGGSARANMDNLSILDEPITRSRARKIKLAFQCYIKRFLNN